ncbi:MAG: hypothetical protein COA43_11895 [Robiginitomaculum sp.]|nr:MAG: hypothetical protein COA43_11895 [Robiginitomaculum sp.]
MGILAKKMSAVSAVPESYAAFASQLGGVHEALLEFAQPISELPLLMSKASVVAGRYKAIFDTSNMDEPAFVFGTADHPILAILQISKPLAMGVAEKKLGAQAAEGGQGEDRALGLLDLILLQSTVGNVLGALRGLLGRDSAGLETKSRHVSLENVVGVDEAEKWLQVKFSLVLKEAPSKEMDKELSITLLLSSLMSDTLVMALSSGGGDLVLDPTNPWSAHMHGTVMRSTLPLKVVVEVLRMSVADCTRLKLGQTIALPGASHKRLSVSTETKTGLQTLATSTLGVSKSNKAVKLLDDIDAEFLSDIGDLMLG